MRTPEQVAKSVYRDWLTNEEDRRDVLEMLVEAACVAQIEPERMVVSTRSGSVRTGTNNTVADLVAVIAGYVADGYTYDELIIEGMTE